MCYHDSYETTSASSRSLALGQTMSTNPIWLVEFSSFRARRAITVQGKQRKKLMNIFKRLVSKKLNIVLSQNSFGLVAIYTTRNISRIGLVQARASGYSLVHSLGLPKIFEKVENFEKCWKMIEKQAKLNSKTFLGAKFVQGWAQIHV